jgi:hypothetical protein
VRSQPFEKTFDYGALVGRIAFGWEMRLVLGGRFGQRHEVDMFDQMFPRKTA